MGAEGGRPTLLLIDREPAWRRRAAAALRAAGYAVRTCRSYPGDARRTAGADLIVLGCADVGRAEQRLVRRLRERNLRLVVLAAALPWEMMRLLFRTGADDVADKPADPEELLPIVRRLL